MWDIPHIYLEIQNISEITYVKKIIQKNTIDLQKVI
nr:MAG TPA: hypothetical protein [Caudoviricetes sp.]